MVQQETKEREAILHFLSIIEFQGSYYFIRNLGCKKLSLEGLGLGIGPIEYCDIIVIPIREYDICDSLCLHDSGSGTHDNRLLSMFSIGRDNIFLVSFRIVAYKGGGRSKNLICR